MIYEYPDKNLPVKQGDIFYPLPFGLLDLDKLFTIQPKGILQDKWDNVKEKEKTFISMPILPTWGIIATQDCDCVRAPMLSLFQIVPFTKTISPQSLPTTPKKWQSLIVRHSRENLKWFYLPEDKKLGFSEKMAVNFHTVFQIPRENLERYRETLRKGRLNQMAYQHYRESIAQYYRRYPYDEWYPLTKEEFEEYSKSKNPPPQPMQYQK